MNDFIIEYITTTKNNNEMYFEIIDYTIQLNNTINNTIQNNILLDDYNNYDYYNKYINHKNTYFNIVLIFFIFEIINIYIDIINDRYLIFILLCTLLCVIWNYK
jgi:hypothetical protein